jgi:hypothetical protein
MITKICLRAALAVVALGLLLTGCTSPVSSNGGAEPIPPPERFAGAFAFADEAGTIELEFPGAKGLAKSAALKAAYAVTGTLTVKVVSGSYPLDITGTYDDATGDLVADASGPVDGAYTEYHMEGIYTPGVGFQGEITRTRGASTVTGVVCANAGTEAGEYYAFGGEYSVTIDYVATPDQGGDPITGSLALDQGTFGVACSAGSADPILGMYRSDSSDDWGFLVGKFTDTTDPEQWVFTITAEDGPTGDGILHKSGDPSTWTVEGTIVDTWTEHAGGYTIEYTQTVDFSATAQ